MCCGFQKDPRWIAGGKGQIAREIDGEEGDDEEDGDETEDDASIVASELTNEVCPQKVEGLSEVLG